MGRKQRSDNSRKYVIPAVQKAFAILELFASRRRGYTMSEVSRILKLPVSTASSLLHSLLHCGYLSRDDRGSFWLTTKLVVEGSRAASQLELREIARGWLRKLTQTTGLASLLSIRDGDHVVCVEKIEGTGVIRIAADVGKRFPFHSTAPGKALLAYLDEKEVEEILQSAGLSATTENTITRVSQLRKEMTRVRSQGYALDNEEYGLGIRGVGAPIFNENGEVVAAIAAGGSVFELDENLKSVVTAVKNTALEISQALGYSETVVTLAPHLRLPRSLAETGK